MGYSHFWYLNKKGNQKNYDKALTLIRQIVTDNIKLLAGANGTGKPEIDKEIYFNGKAPNDHETFWLPEKLMDLETQYPHEIAEILGHKENVVFDFCKTDFKPYDIVVTQCLVILKHFLQEDAAVSSDGDREGFEEAVRIVNEKYRTNQFKEDLNVQEFKNPYDYKKEED